MPLTCPPQPPAIIERVADAIWHAQISRSLGWIGDATTLAAVAINAAEQASGKCLTQGADKSR